MVAASPTVFDTLTLWEKFGHKLLVYVDKMDSTVILKGDYYICSLSLEQEFLLNVFSSDKSHLLNGGNLTAGCVT